MTAKENYSYLLVQMGRLEEAVKIEREVIAVRQQWLGG